MQRQYSIAYTERTCVRCGKQFYARKTDVARGYGNICSHVCRVATPDEVAARFWPRVDKRGECWLWTGTKTPKGYGHTKVRRKLTLTHRVAWILTNGPIPDGMVVMHTCDNPPCVRPDHLQLGTTTDNRRDCFAKGRAVIYSGDDHVNARLTTEQAVAIRARYDAGESGAQLASAYGVTPSTICDIGRRRTWKHI